MAGIDSLKDSAIGESAAKYWEKTIKDMPMRGIWDKRV